jgi:hypothetical protein
VDSTTKDGEMPPSIPSALHYSQTNLKFTGLMILDIDMNRSSIVHRVRHMLGVGAGVILITTLIGSGMSLSSLGWVLLMSQVLLHQEIYHDDGVDERDAIRGRQQTTDDRDRGQSIRVYRCSILLS